MWRGFVCLWRRSLDSQVFQNAGLWKVWTWCLMKAAHKEHWITLRTGRGETEVLIKPGQFIYGRKKAARELRMKQSSVRNCMQKLKGMRNLDSQPDTHYSIVTICHWGRYQLVKSQVGQASGQAKDNQRTTKGQPKDTYNNDNNVDNENNKEERGRKKSREAYPVDLVVEENE